MSKKHPTSARSRARELIVQSLYQRQIAGHDVAELMRQFHGRPDYSNVDQKYYDEVLTEICRDTDSLEQGIGELADRPVEQLDPVERSILLLGYFELRSMPELPYKVIINESVNLAKRFGSIDGHKFVNALLDRAATTLRSTTHTKA